MKGLNLLVLISFGSGAFLLTGCNSGDKSTNSTSSTTTTTSTTTTSATTSWRMCHGTVQHTGQAAVKGPQTATLKWKYQYDASAGTGTSSPSAPKSMVVDKNNIMYTTANGTLYAFNSDGTVLWSITGIGTNGGVVALSPDESTVYTSNGSGSKVLAYTASSGTLLWTNTDATDVIYGELTIASDGTIYYGSKDTFLYAISPTDGKLKWKYQTDGSFAPLASPTLSLDEKTIYAGSGDPNNDPGGTVYAINTSDGTLKWSKSVDGNRSSGVVVGSDDSLYVNGQSVVNHLSASDGSSIWQSSANTASALVPSLSSDGVVYAGRGQDGKVFAIDSTSTSKWSFQTAANPDFDPSNPKDPQYGVPTNIVIGSDGVVYFGSMGDKFYAVKPDGTELFAYSTANNISENCPAIGPDGTLYFSASDGFIYAIKG